MRLVHNQASTSAICRRNLDDSLDVRGNVKRAETKGLLDQFNEVNMKFAEPMSDDEMNDLQGEPQEKSMLPVLGLDRKSLMRCACHPGIQRLSTCPG